MRLDYTYKKTAQINDYLRRLDIAKDVINILPKLPYIEENLRRHSLLKSAVFSARIEGNRLKLEDVKCIEKERKLEDIAKIEIHNILKALRWLYSTKAPKKVTKGLILNLHKLVLTRVSSPAGRFRTEASAIFNQAGAAIYMPPPPDEVSSLIQRLIKQINSSREPGPINAAISHFAFEKIHPFIDGNGRVGRLLSTFVLKQAGYGFRGLVSLEEYLEKNRQTYYDLLLLQKRDITPFVEFFLEAVVVQAESTIDNLKSVKEELPEDKLLPRRREILEIIRDHHAVSFDFIQRRFSKVPNSTLHYDLRQLRKDGFVRKIGSTRGALYAPK